MSDLIHKQTAQEQLDLLLSALHQAECEGYELPKCIDDAWKVITFGPDYEDFE